jgi:tetratricopeptide (TPR) repeat protein
MGLDSLDIIFLEGFQDSLDLNNLGNVFQIGYKDIYDGNNDRGNRILEFVLSQVDEPNYELLHAVAVQNLKNGNFAIAYDYLSRAADLSDEVYGYFGWVMLYYFKDYERALVYFDKYDVLTPGFSDAPAGEDINYLRGVAHLQLNRIDSALHYFDYYIKEKTAHPGEDWVEVSAFYYKGVAHYLKNDYFSAKTSFETAIKYYEDYTESYYYLYLTLKRMKEPEAIKTLYVAKALGDKNLFRRDIYVTYLYPVYLQMIDMELEKEKK